MILLKAGEKTNIAEEWDIKMNIGRMWIIACIFYSAPAFAQEGSVSCQKYGKEIKCTEIFIFSSECKIRKLPDGSKVIICDPKEKKRSPKMSPANDKISGY